MSSICNCSGSNGGGTKCPDHHVAVCIQEKDGRCYGECIPIPPRFEYDSKEFQVWLSQIIKRETIRCGQNFVSINYSYSF